MKGVVIVAAAAAVLAVGSEALTLRERSNNNAPRVVHLPFEKKTVSRPASQSRRRRLMAKRSGTISSTLTNFEDGSLYFCNVTMGTPPQPIAFHIDTGSSDLWANVANSQLCEEPAQEVEEQGQPACSASGTYNANSSSTYKYVNSEFEIKYADGTGAAGDYATDTVNFGSSTLTNQQFGIGYESSSSEGVMGIGYPGLEGQVQIAQLQPYNNLPQQMVSQGLIAAPAYSLWLDDLFSSTGNVLFGGVDKDKYTGELKTLQIQPEGSTFLEMIVNLDGVTLNSNGKNTTISTGAAIPVLLDSGSTLTYLPSQTAQTIYDAVGATFDSQEQVAFCPCSVANSTDTIDFLFDGQVISVGMAELVLDSGLGPADSDTGCTFGIAEQTNGDQNGEGTYTLGDSFIRNAYIVYDLSRNEISLAQSNFNSDSSSITEITSGNAGTTGTGVPASQATASSSGYAAPTKAPSKAAWAGLAGAGLLLAAGL